MRMSSPNLIKSKKLRVFIGSFLLIAASAMVFQVFFLFPHELGRELKAMVLRQNRPLVESTSFILLTKTFSDLQQPLRKPASLPARNIQVWGGGYGGVSGERSGRVFYRNYRDLNSTAQLFQLLDRQPPYLWGFKKEFQLLSKGIEPYSLFYWKEEEADQVYYYAFVYHRDAIFQWKK